MGSNAFAHADIYKVLFIKMRKYTWATYLGHASYCTSTHLHSKKKLILVQIKVKCIKLMYTTTLERDNSNSTIWKQKHMYNESRHELETHIYRLIKMMSVKTHGGKTIRSEVTQHTQKIYKETFFRSRIKNLF